jgi:transcriptional regulator with XRE-family HTH domain
MAHRIKELLKEKGHTQQSLADKLGIARESLSRMLKSPSYPTLEKIASVLNVSLWELFASQKDVIGNEELTALIHHKGDFYKASTIEELEKIVEKIRRNKE